MKFVSPLWLWALFLLPAFYALILFEQHLRAKKLETFARSAVWSRLIPERDPSLGLRKGLVLCIALGLIFVALARPQFGSHEETVQVAGLDLMIVLDVSNSMETEDVIPTRLKKAKHLIKALLDRLNGDRVGLVSFAASSYVSSPLTTDLEYVLDTLDIQTPRSIQNQGTDIGQALDTALKALERGAQENSGPNPGGVASRVIVLVSDGEDHEDEAMRAAAKIKESGTKFYALGVGTEKGGPVPIRDENGTIQGFKRDRVGQPVMSTFHPDFLTQLAAEGGGKYWNVSTSEEELNELIQDLGGLDRTDFAERKFLVYEDRFQIPLFLAFLLLILELSLPARKKTTAVVLLLLLFLSVGSGPSAYAATHVDSYLENQKGIEAFKQGKFEEAQRNFGAAQARDPSQPEPEFNQGVIYLQQGETEKAIHSFSQSARIAKESNYPEVLGKSLYNLGNAFAKKGDLKSAVPSYLGAIEVAQAMKNKPLEAEARKNLELLFQEIKKEQQKQDSKSKNDSKEQKNQAQQESKQDNDNKSKNDQKSQAQKDQGKESKKEEKNKDSANSSEDSKDRKNQKDSDQSQEKKEGSEQKESQAKGEQSPENRKTYRQGSQQKFESKKLSEEDANRVISELADREKALQEKLQGRHGKTKTTAKDW
ncbi:MAG: VWA domain-containing protein [Bdellovibrio sp.]|nr:VWA domain-containing protein [Bdellovibrio sp.]